MLRAPRLLSVVMPVFNEEETLPETLRRVLLLGERLAPAFDVEVVAVDDGSRDRSLAILREWAATTEAVKVVSFSRNFGHQVAITAGVDHAAGDYVANIDADLQDPPELIPEMIAIAEQGADVVYGKRRSRAGESTTKRLTAAAFYRLLSYLCETEIPADTGDFRLMSRRVVDAFRQMRERHRFVRGMVPWVGFRSTALEYDRDRRFAGETKFPLKKMLAFAAVAILSFSHKPLTVAVRLGLLTIAAGVVGAFYMLYLKLFHGSPVAGLTAILVSIVLFSGVQILLIGLTGEYIARIFEEVKGRPLYIVADTVNVGPPAAMPSRSASGVRADPASLV